MCWFTNSSGSFFFFKLNYYGFVSYLSTILSGIQIAAEFGWNRGMDSFATYVYGHSLYPFEVYFLILKTYSKKQDSEG